jgi:hypothetical protein
LIRISDPDTSSLSVVVRPGNTILTAGFIVRFNNDSFSPDEPIIVDNSAGDSVF